MRKVIFTFVALSLVSSTVFAGTRESLETIRESISDHQQMQNYEIDYFLNGSKLRMSGSVGSQEEKILAETLALESELVSKVDNQLVVIPVEINKADVAPTTDEELAERVKAVLQEKGHLEQALDIQSMNGKIVLRGDRKTFREVDAILSQVLMVEGVQSLRSDITVAGKEYMKHFPEKG